MSLIAILGYSSADIKECKVDPNIPFQATQLFGKIKRVLNAQVVDPKGYFYQLMIKKDEGMQLVRNIDGKFEKSGPFAYSPIIARTYLTNTGETAIFFRIIWHIERVDGKRVSCEQMLPTPYTIGTKEYANPSILASQAYKAMIYAKTLRYLIKAFANPRHEAFKTVIKNLKMYSEILLSKSATAVSQNLLSRTGQSANNNHQLVLPAYPIINDVKFAGKELFTRDIAYYENRQLSKDGMRWIKTDKSGEGILGLHMKYLLQKIIVVSDQLTILDQMLNKPAAGFKETFRRYQVGLNTAELGSSDADFKGLVQGSSEERIRKLKKFLDNRINDQVYCELLGNKLINLESYIRTLLSELNRTPLRNEIAQLKEVKMNKASAWPLFEKLQKLTEYHRCLTHFWEERIRCSAQALALGRRIQVPRLGFFERMTALNIEQRYPQARQELAPLTSPETIALLKEVREQFQFPGFCLEQAPFALKFSGDEVVPFSSRTIATSLIAGTSYLRIFSLTVPPPVAAAAVRPVPIIPAAGDHLLQAAAAPAVPVPILMPRPPRPNQKEQIAGNV